MLSTGINPTNENIVEFNKEVKSFKTNKKESGRFVFVASGRGVSSSLVSYSRLAITMGIFELQENFQKSLGIECFAVRRSAVYIFEKILSNYIFSD